MLILGIDPGIGITGYSFVEYVSTPKGDKYSLVSSGSIQTSKDSTLPQRLLELRGDLDCLIKKYTPDCASIEQLFFFRNKTTIIPVAQARGIIMVTLEENKIPMFEYQPRVIKKAITGSGNASKQEVKLMLNNFIELDKNIKLDDTIDATAIAVCHSLNARFKERVK